MRIIIICEGQTEQRFCNDVLQPFLNQNNIYIEYPTVKKTGGGIVNWSALKRQIETHLKQDKTAYVTTFIDFYGIYQHHEYPYWLESKNNPIKSDALTKIEDGMKEDIEGNLRDRFLPYIQLHEFEALLFSEMSVFLLNFERHEFSDYKYLEETIEHYPNPENINDGIQTAPSKRLEKIIKGYKSDKENLKVVYGSLLSHDIGIIKIREKCPRFNEWLQKIESL